MTIENARRWTFGTSIAVNLGATCLNVGLVGFNLWMRNAWLVGFHTALACATAVVAWLLVIHEDRARVKQDVIESYREEQFADTRIKESLAKLAEAGDPRIGMAVKASTKH